MLFFTLVAIYCGLVTWFEAGLMLFGLYLAFRLSVKLAHRWLMRVDKGYALRVRLVEILRGAAR